VPIGIKGASSKMSKSDVEKELAELEKSFAILGRDAKAAAGQEIQRVRDEEWKTRDPEGYKKDMEKMCKEMLGENWRPTYEAMLREEFPEEFS
jgi:hypothetical protein